MLGVILCGGQSKRMGADKGLLPLNNSTWVQGAYDKLLRLDMPVVISVNGNQHNLYADLFNPEWLTEDNPLLQLKGPLCGVLSVHLRYPGEDLYILACDMPLMEMDLLRELLRHYHDDTHADAYLFLNGGEPEPLCGIYRCNALADIYRLYLKGALLKHSMKFALDQIHVAMYELSEEQKKYFRNFNAHADINGM